MELFVISNKKVFKTNDPHRIYTYKLEKLAELEKINEFVYDLLNLNHMILRVR